MDHTLQLEQACHFRSPPATFAGQNYIRPPALVPTHPDRLELSPSLERFRQAGERVLVELLAGLVGVALNPVDRNPGRRAIAAHTLQAGRSADGLRRVHPGWE